jgi:hypothetical protein
LTANYETVDASAPVFSERRIRRIKMPEIDDLKAKLGLPPVSQIGMIVGG